MQTDSSPHLHDGRTLGVVMTDVCIALAPGLLCYVWLFGPGVLLQCILAVSFALLFEFAVLRLRGRDPRPFLRDGSAIVTAMLFAVSISPLAAWWVCLCGIAFAIIIAKHAFGGIGYNIFNPAMAGFCIRTGVLPGADEHLAGPAGAGSRRLPGQHLPHGRPGAGYAQRRHAPG